MGRPRIAENRRPRGSGAITRYRNGWRAQLRWKGEDGRTICRTRVTPTKREAEAALGAFREERDAGAGRVERRWSLGDWCDAWLATRDDLRPTSLDQLRRSLGHVTAAIGPVPLREVTVRHVESLDAALRAKGLAPGTRRLARSALAGALKEARRRGLLSRDPLAAVRPIRSERAPFAAPDPAWLARFRAACETDPLGDAFLILAATGLRRGELAGLRWSSVDLDAGLARVTASRTVAAGVIVEGLPKAAASVRAVPLSPLVRDALRRIRARQVAKAGELLAAGVPTPLPDYVLSDDLARPLHPEVLSRRFAAMARRADLGDVHLHSLRHLTATLALQDGASLPEVAALLGHASPAMVSAVYGHLAASALSPLTDRVGARLGQ